MDTKLTLSVHQLVDFLLRKGSIDDRVYNERTMEEGTRLHVFQEKSGEKYRYTEYYLKQEFHIQDFTIILQGRADGILKRGPLYIIDEIKTTNSELIAFEESEKEWHLGQAKCYAYMFAKENAYEQIGVNITYIKQGSNEQYTREYVFNYLELEQYVYSLLSEYLSFYRIITSHWEEKERSIAALHFPYKTLRPGQKELIDKAIENAVSGGVLFCEAPTGIGKTIATLYPYIKSLENDLDKKIFYLTAKNSGKEAAKNAVDTLTNEGLVAKTIVLSAKEKICFTKGADCNPDECPFAKEYYSKIKEAETFALLNENTYDYFYISRLAEQFEICPFELQLDLSDFCDIIICDYNYVFDPLAHLKQFFDEGETNYLLLVDEAHNLVDRSRDMYSATMKLETLTEALDFKKGTDARAKRLVNRIKKFYEDIEDKYSGDEDYVVIDDIDTLVKPLYRFLDAYIELSKEDHKAITKPLKELYLEVNRFVRIYEITYDSDVHYYVSFDNDTVEVHIYERDASHYLANSLSLFHSSLLFSATLTPNKYYMNLLGGDDMSDFLSLPSPFPPNHFKVMVAPSVSTRYRNRESGYDSVMQYILSFISGKVGNYFIFFPSYEYMNQITNRWIIRRDIKLYVQEKEMDEETKNEFLSHFINEPEVTTVAFVVMGSIFSEGIDLTYDRLIGVAVVGVGLPRINYESDLIRSYYNDLEMDGYAYAYKNPGINKVMQAMGRVIRSEDDMGVGLLIDERYVTREYRDMLTHTWPNYTVTRDANAIEATVKDFFNKKNEE